MALALIAHGDKTVALGSDSATGERGFLCKMVNRTGKASVKGEIVGPSSTADREAVLEDTGFDPIGVIQEAGVAEGSEMWVWMTGSICQVLMKDATAAVRAYVALADDVNGRAYGVAVPSANPAVAEHFREIGHFLESKDAGTNVLALAILHFN
jgi:hypothetical protein